MKNLLRSIIAIIPVIIGISLSVVNAQSPPQAIPYQAVARDASGNLIAGQNICLRFSIHDVTANGTIVYQETQTATTNTLGLFTVNIGQGAVVSGTFSTINWGGGNKFTQVELDVACVNSYVNMGTQQMMSVPYAMFAGGAHLTPGNNVGEVMVWNGTSWTSSCPTGQTPCSGYCVNLLTDANNCGTCGNVCALANATSACAGASCIVVSCNAGYGNCNNNPTDGCETYLNGDPNNCGSCGHICNIPNASSSCSNGICVIASCNAGFADCDNNPANGCEINKNTNPLNCGACGVVCFVQNGTAGCSGGNCIVASCNSGYADCNNSPTDGCELYLMNNPNNCGSCGHICILPNTASSYCSNGQCFVSSCNAGWGDCDPGFGNGCETFVMGNNHNNCGACGQQCNFFQSCVNGVCQ